MKSICLSIVLCCLAGCGGKAKSPGKTAPAKVERHPSESDLFRITLTPEAVRRLAITTKKIERRHVPRHRTLGGEVVIPTGKAIIVSAPLNGTLGPPDKGTIPTPGETLKPGQPIFSFVPLLPPERDVPSAAELVQMANARASLESARIVAAGDVKQTQAEVDAARIQYNLATRLFEDMTGTRRALNEAEAALSVARKKLEAAVARKKVLDSLSLTADKGKLKTFEITSPDQGILRNLSATRGQRVTAGAPLFEVANLSTVWIRVPVYVGQLDEFDLKADVQIGELKGRLRRAPRTAKRIESTPPTADPTANSVDVYYSIANSDGKLRPGQRVGVTLPLKTEWQSLVVPWGAIVYDYHGTAWVYEKIAENTFRRRRVFVRYSVDHLAVLESKKYGGQETGPPVGTEVVVDGAAELFGTEFGAGK